MLFRSGVYHVYDVIHSKAGRHRSAAASMLRFLTHAHSDISSLPSDVRAIRILLASATNAAASLALLPSSDAWLHEPIAPHHRTATSSTSGAVVTTLRDVRGEVARLSSCLELLSLPASVSDTTRVYTLVNAPYHEVFTQLVFGQLFLQAAGLARSCATDAAEHTRMLCTVVSTMAKLCARAQSAVGADEGGGGMDFSKGVFEGLGCEAAWAQLRHAIDLFEGDAWPGDEWQREAMTGHLLPSGCLRLAAAKVCLIRRYHCLRFRPHSAFERALCVNLQYCRTRNRRISVKLQFTSQPVLLF